MIYLILICSSLILSMYSTYRWRKMGFYITSPAGACLFLWSFVWFIHYLDVFEYYELSDQALLYSFLPVLSIFIGEEIGKRMRQRSRRRKTNVKRMSLFLSVNSLIALSFALIGLFAVYLIFGNPLTEGVGNVIKQARSEDGVAMLRGSPFYMFAQYMVISRAFLYLSFFSLIPLWLQNRKLAVKIGIATMVTAVIADMSWGSRTLILDALIIIVIWLAIGYPRSERKRGLKTKFYVWIAVPLTFIALFLGAQRITESTRNTRSVEVQGLEIPYSVQHLLKYYTFSLVAFDQTIRNDKTYTYGLMSFGGVLNVLHLLRIYRNESLPVYEIMYEWEVENPNYADGAYNRANIYSWVRYFYTDFGITGLILIPVFLGIIAGRTMKKIRVSSQPDYFDYTVLTICFYLVARSPILFSLRHDYVVLGILMAFVVSRFIKQKTNRKPIRSE